MNFTLVLEEEQSARLDAFTNSLKTQLNHKYEAFCETAPAQVRTAQDLTRVNQEAAVLGKNAAAISRSNVIRFAIDKLLKEFELNSKKFAEEFLQSGVLKFPGRPVAEAIPVEKPTFRLTKKADP